MADERPSTTVHVVYDLGGGGRVVGVFRDVTRAHRIAAVNPAYYKVTSCALDRVRPEALSWAYDVHRIALEHADAQPD